MEFHAGQAVSEKTGHATVVTTGEVVNNTRLEGRRSRPRQGLVIASLHRTQRTNRLLLGGGGRGSRHARRTETRPYHGRTPWSVRAAPFSSFSRPDCCRGRLPVAGFGHILSLGQKHKQQIRGRAVAGGGRGGDTVVSRSLSRLSLRALSPSLSPQVDRRRAVADGRPTRRRGGVGTAQGGAARGGRSPTTPARTSKSNTLLSLLVDKTAPAGLRNLVVAALLPMG